MLNGCHILDRLMCGDFFALVRRLLLFCKTRVSVCLFQHRLCLHVCMSVCACVRLVYVCASLRASLCVCVCVCVCLH